MTRIFVFVFSMLLAMQSFAATLPSLSSCSAVATSDIFVGRHGSDTSDCKASGSQISSMVLGSDGETSSIAGLTSAANKLPYYTGSGTAALADLTSFGRTVIDDTGIADIRSTIGQPVATIPFQVNAGSNLTWTDMPLAETMLSGSTRAGVKFDLTNYTQCRLVVLVTSTPGSANAKLIAKYSTSYIGSTVGNYSDLGTSEISASISSASVISTSSWTNIATSAKADVNVVITGSGGDGAVDPALGSISVQCR